MAARASLNRQIAVALRLVLPLLFVLLLTAHPAVAKDATDIPFLKTIHSCNPSLGSDCEQTPRSDPQCAVDADCTMGCAKDQPIDDQIPQCRPTDNTSSACMARLGNPLQDGVACGCLAETHKCGYLPAPKK